MENFKSGTHLKERATLLERIGHYVGIKTSNNICKDRNWWEIIKTYGEQDEWVYDHVKLVVATIMLGNAPNSEGELGLAARLRLTVAFWPQYADAEMSRQSIDARMPAYCNPFVVAEERREKKLKKEQAKLVAHPNRKIDSVMRAWDAKEEEKQNYIKTQWKMWLLRNRYFASSLMKIQLLYIHESSQASNEFLALDFKWTQSGNIIRIAVAKCRLELSQRASTPGPIDWSGIEHMEKSQDGKYDVKSGIVMHFHGAALKVAKKVMKRSFMGIVEVKATGVEETMQLGRGPLPVIYGIPGRPSLEELHFIAWIMASDENPIFLTALLQVAGMSRSGCESVRDWLFQYYTYDIPDDSLKKRILAFQRHSMADYLLLKTLFKLRAYYVKRERMFFLPLPIAQRQQEALRRRLSVAPWCATPYLLGIHYQCHGCQKMANAVVQATPFPTLANHCALQHSRHRPYSPLTSETQNVVVVYDQIPRTLETHQARCALRHTSKSPPNGSPPPLPGEEKKEALSYLNVAFYNVPDGKAYCVRNKRRQLLVARPQPSAENVVVRCREAKLTVHCTELPTRSLVGGGEAVFEAEDEEAGEEDSEQGHFAPAYEQELRTVMRDLCTQRPTERLEQYVRNHALLGQLSEQKTQPVKESNKSRIAKVVNEPLQRMYNCRQPLQPVDMIGVVRGGLVLCVECGCMTEYKQHNQSPLGPVCMHHAGLWMTRDHPAFALLPEKKEQPRSLGQCCCCSQAATTNVTASDKHFKIFYLKSCLGCSKMLRKYALKQSCPLVLAVEELPLQIRLLIRQ
jgi:hypothetical protein